MSRIHVHVATCSYSFPSLVLGVQIEILPHSIVPQQPVLVYHGEGDCKWNLTAKELGNTSFSPPDTNGQKLPLENNEIPGGLQATCVVKETLRLDATILTTGTRYI